MVECVSCEYLVAMYQCMATERRETFIVRMSGGRVQKKNKNEQMCKTRGNHYRKDGARC